MKQISTQNSKMLQETRFNNKTLFQIPYWPDVDKSVIHQEFTICNDKEELFGDFTRRRLRLLGPGYDRQVKNSTIFLRNKFRSN